VDPLGDDGAVSQPIRAVLLDFHATLVDQGEADEWLDAAIAHAGSGIELEPVERAAILGRLDDIWIHARDFDPHSTRDHSAQNHHAVFAGTMEGHVAVELRDALYEVMLTMWRAYDDSAPLLDALRERGVRTAVLSNVGVDIRPVMEREGLRADAVVLSCEVGAVKPEPEIFQAALDALEVSAEETLMVGDSWKDDSGAVALGIRTLLLPRTRGATHGLDLVLRLVE
jgi:HAD superfamily hydrolase (TIGR01509 family)